MSINNDSPISDCVFAAGSELCSVKFGNFCSFKVGSYLSETFSTMPSFRQCEPLNVY